MLHERVVDNPGVLGASSYSKNELLAPHIAQAVVEAVVSRLGVENTPTTTVEYLGGMALDIPRMILDMPGHDLEALYLDKLKELRHLTSGFKLKVLDKVGREVPGLLPSKGALLIDALRALGDPSTTQEV